jgi:thiamine transport system substrate-binding protein
MTSFRDLFAAGRGVESGRAAKSPSLRLLVLILTLTVLLGAAGCGSEDVQTETTAPPAADGAEPADETTTTEGQAEQGGEVVLMTHDSFDIPDEVLRSFEEQYGYRVSILRSGDAGSMLNQAILTRDNPVADVIFGVDNTFLSRALDEDLFEAYASPNLEAVPEAFVLDPENRVTPIDYGDVTLNYDKETVGPDADVPVPQELRDLTQPQYRGLLVVENPATSSPGLAFLLATVAEFSEEGDYTWQDFWRDLRANDVLAVSGWEEAYYSEFSGGSGEGDRPLVVSYASSPPAEVAFAETPLDEAPTGVVEAGAFRQVEFAGIVRGANNRAGAEALVDFMLDLEFQEAIPMSMFVFPVNEQAELPEVFTEHTTLPASPATMDIEQIGENRERWIEEWTEIVVR